jgi:hypothetical protein
MLQIRSHPPADPPHFSPRARVSAGDTPTNKPQTRALAGQLETTQRNPMWVVALSCDCEDRAAGR